MAQSNGPLHDLDDQQTFDKQKSWVEKPECRNLAVKFSSSAAFSGLNLGVETFRQLLADRQQDETCFSCLWLNLWGWTPDHQSIISEVAKRYELSPRLAHSICPRGQNITASGTGLLATGPRPIHFEQASSMADIFNAVWHFGTVDFGRRYVCLGWNALFFLPHSKESAYRSKPNAVRVWSSILLCDDGTVVSVFEEPPNVNPYIIARIRHNQINVFRNLSNANSYLQSALMQTSIRSFGPLEACLPDASSEMASLLLYYLFDDWVNMFVQVSGSEHSYRHQLELLRVEMVQHPKPEQIDLLHQLGRQLSALRSICKSYHSLIEQLVRNQMALSSHASNQASHNSRSRDEPTGTNVDSPPYVIRLPLGAVARFERLLTRIDLCAITELDDCIAEKDGLVQMNFNLINLMEAQTVERLTRTTILLAKVTILFLPTSLATSYFSMQLKGIQALSLRAYWITFVIVAIVTTAFLIGFERLSARYSGKLVYTSLTRVFLDHRRRKR